MNTLAYFCQALTQWLATAIISIEETTGEELTKTQFETDADWMIIGDWSCLSYMNWEGGIDCEPYDLSEEAICGKYGFAAEDHSKVVALVKHELEAK